MTEATHDRMTDEHFDPAGARFGMWLFIFSEILLFGGLFILYTCYAWDYNSQFLKGSHALSRTIGTVNTLILLSSSLTVALSIAAIQKGRRTGALILLIFTLLFGAAFLLNKGFEWRHKFETGMYPNSKTLLKQDKGEVMFYNLYFTMTGLHALHVIVGMGLLTVSAWFVWRGMIHEKRYVLLENSGLYWHLVDVIWIFLYPLFYLIT